jgi:hypothetical protein
MKYIELNFPGDLQLETEMPAAGATRCWVDHHLQTGRPSVWNDDLLA